MGRFQFCPTKEVFDSPELGMYTAFGICVFEIRQGVAVKVDCIPDISVSERLVFALAERCTRLQLSPCHLRAVVMDILP